MTRNFVGVALCLVAGLCRAQVEPTSPATAVSTAPATPMQQMMDQARARASEYPPLMPAIGGATSGAADPSQIRHLVDQAHQRTQVSSFDPAMLKVQSPDKPSIEAIADQARARGQKAFESFVTGERSPRIDGNKVLPRADDPAPIAGLVVVALSSSMPEETLREYMSTLDGHRDAVVVLRGFIGGASAVKPTEAWLESLLRKDSTDPSHGHNQVRVVIDPLIYRSLDIRQVPAVTYLPGVQDIHHCEHESFASASIAFGAASVDAALVAIRKAGLAVPDSVIKSYEGIGWESRP